MALGKRTDLFLSLQTLNVGVAEGKTWKLVLDRGIRWNSSYAMIRRALELRPALDVYTAMLHVSTDSFNKETFEQDYLNDREWDALAIIRDQLMPLFLLTKDLEGNADLCESGGKASHRALWETLIGIEHILDHFEGLETQAKNGDFNNHPGIQNSITEAWNKTKLYYTKTDASIAWVAAVVLHPRFKWAYFEKV